MRLLDEHLANGDTVEIGEEVEASSAEQPTGGGLRILAVHRGEKTEYVALRFTAREDGELDLPDNAEVLSLRDGTGFANPSVWVLVPKSEYATEE